MRKLIEKQRQFLIYLAGGLICAVLDIGIMQLLIMRGTSLVIAVSAGFAVGLVVNYAFHASLTFRSSANASSFMRFLCVVGINYVLTLACVSLSVWLVGIALIGKIASLPIIAINGYALGKHWIFR
jgi:putative flippase GtrA